MALVNDDSIADRARKLESLRMTNVSSRLTRRETDHLDELAKKHRLQREAAVLAALKSEPLTLSRLVPAAYPEINPELYPLAERSLLAHLLKLVKDGRAAQAGDAFALRA